MILHQHITPSPLRGEGWGEGGATRIIRAIPPSLTLPRKGGGNLPFTVR